MTAPWTMDFSALQIFDTKFRELHERSLEVLDAVPEEKLYAKPRELDRTFAMFSCGEYLLRSAAAVEQTFLGVTRKLWDDPFEWTLPEALSTKAAVAAYIREAEEARLEGFRFLGSDEVLPREMPSPEKLRPIFEILLETLAKAEHYQGRATAVMQFHSDLKPPRR